MPFTSGLLASFGGYCAIVLSKCLWSFGLKEGFAVGLKILLSNNPFMESFDLSMLDYDFFDTFFGFNTESIYTSIAYIVYSIICFSIWESDSAVSLTQFNELHPNSFSLEEDTKTKEALIESDKKERSNLFFFYSQMVLVLLVTFGTKMLF